MIDKEKSYEVIQNPEKELLFNIKLRASAPKQPKLLYANGKHAILYRNEQESVLIDFLPEEIKQSLNKLEKVLFVEFDKQENLVREYDVDVFIRKKLPLCV